MKKTLLLVLFATLMCGVAIAQKVVRFDNPKLSVYLPDNAKPTGRAVLILPGGGYVNLASDSEGFWWASYFNERGIAVAVLDYKMPGGGNYNVPFNDVESAMRIIHNHAAEWGIRTSDIGIMGSSAGGHLAATYATYSKPELAPAFQILFYPVITMDKSYTHMGSHDNLLGKTASKALEEKYSMEKQVKSTTPRALILIADDDDIVPTENGVNYYLALHKQHVPASLHIYPTGGHGFGYRVQFPYRQEMLADLGAWLRSF